MEGKNSVNETLMFRSITRTTPRIFLNLMFYHFLLGFLVCFFFAHKVSSTIDAWHKFKSSYDETQWRESVRQKGGAYIRSQAAL